MAGKNKLKKFADLAKFENVVENKEFVRFNSLDITQKPHATYGKWNQEKFGNTNPIVLELACGKGEYTVALAQKYPDKNFIGIDIKGNRIWSGAKKALDSNLYNIYFLRTRIELLQCFFAPGEVSEIWITFPDPFLKKSRINNRLTAHRFLDIYKHVLNESGKLHLKTDDATLYKFTLKSIQSHAAYKLEITEEDIYSLDQLPHPDLDIKTFYEKMHLENELTIKYVGFSLT